MKLILQSYRKHVLYLYTAYAAHYVYLCLYCCVYVALGHKVLLAVYVPDVIDRRKLRHSKQFQQQFNRNYKILCIPQYAVEGPLYTILT